MSTAVQSDEVFRKGNEAYPRLCRLSIFELTRLARSAGKRPVIRQHMAHSVGQLVSGSSYGDPKASFLMIFLKLASIDHAWTFVQAAGQLEMFKSLGRCLLPLLCDGRYGRVVLRTCGGGNHTSRPWNRNQQFAGQFPQGLQNSTEVLTVDIQLNFKLPHWCEQRLCCGSTQVFTGSV